VFIAGPATVGAWRDPRARLFHLAAGATLVTVYNLTDWDAANTGPESGENVFRAGQSSRSWPCGGGELLVKGLLWSRCPCG
jgi:hypothetical protein